jgi:hypothetical protein
MAVLECRQAACPIRGIDRRLVKAVAQVRDDADDAHLTRVRQQYLKKDRSGDTKASRFFSVERCDRCQELRGPARDRRASAVGGLGRGAGLGSKIPVGRTRPVGFKPPPLPPPLPP